MTLIIHPCSHLGLQSILQSCFPDSHFCSHHSPPQKHYYLSLGLLFSEDRTCHHRCIKTSHNIPRFLLSHLIDGGNRSLERLSDLPELTQLLNGSTKIWTQVSVTPKAPLSATLSCYTAQLWPASNLSKYGTPLEDLLKQMTGLQSPSASQVLGASLWTSWSERACGPHLKNHYLKKWC